MSFPHLYIDKAGLGVFLGGVVHALGTILCTYHVLSLRILTAVLEVILLLFPSCRWENRGSEWFSSMTKLSQLNVTGARTQPQQSLQHQIAQHRVSAQYIFAMVIIVLIRHLISSSNFVRFNLLFFSRVIHCVVGCSPSCSLLSYTNIPDVLGPWSSFFFFFLL